MNCQWNVVQIDRLTSDGFVVTVHYTVNAVDVEFTASTYGTVGYIQENKSYTPFANLTKEQVIGWVQNSLGKEAVETALAAQIDTQRNPAQESGLPW